MKATRPHAARAPLKLAPWHGGGAAEALAAQTDGGGGGAALEAMAELCMWIDDGGGSGGADGYWRRGVRALVVEAVVVEWYTYSGR